MNLLWRIYALCFKMIFRLDFGHSSTRYDGYILSCIIYNVLLFDLDRPTTQEILNSLASDKASKAKLVTSLGALSVLLLSQSDGTTF